MENKVEEIMKEYKDGVENIDKKYDVKEVREPKMLDTQELDDKIKYEKEFIAKLEYEGADVNKDMIEKAKARLELAESEKKEIEENNEKKLDRYNKSVEKREEKVLENDKMKHSMVVLPSGREVTMAEKDKMDKQELKDKAIRGLTQESKTISEELLKKDQELKTINQELIDVDYAIRISTERDDDKIAKRDELNQKLLELREEMKGLSELQEQCNAYLEELKAPTKEEKAFSEAWNETYKDEQGVQTQGAQTQGTQTQDAQTQDTQTQDTQTQGAQTQEIQTQEESMSIYKIEIGRTAKIIMAGGYEFNVGSKEVKKGLNLSEEQVSKILDEYMDNENSKLLAQQLVKDNKLDTTVLNVITKSGIDENGKRELINSYFDKCLLPKEEDKLDIKYNAKEMSKVNILKRLFKNELNNNEKCELLLKAKKAEELGIAKVEGEYKITAIEKMFGKFGGTLRLPEPSEKQLEEAYAMNNEFKNQIKQGAQQNQMNKLDQAQQQAYERETEKFREDYAKRSMDQYNTRKQMKEEKSGEER